MARFVGSSLTSENHGEDTLVRKLIEYGSDDWIIYRNRVIYGTEFDVAALVPDWGMIIFEVKDWKRDTVIGVHNGESAIIWAYDKNTGRPFQDSSNPLAQARGYVFKADDKIKSKTGKSVLVCPLVCFPSLTWAEYKDAQLDIICEEEYTFCKEDFVSKETFLKKLLRSYRLFESRSRYHDHFDKKLMFLTRQVFEGNIPEQEKTPPGMEPAPLPQRPEKKAYSLLAYFSADEINDILLDELSRQYDRGTKIIAFFEKVEDLQSFASKILEVLHAKHLNPLGNRLQLDFGVADSCDTQQIGRSFSVFYCQGYVVPNYNKRIGTFVIENGKVQNENQAEFLQYADDATNFNYAQFLVEHCDIHKHIIVRAGAGTGKTYTMISRIAYICAMDYSTMREIATRIVMITFTDEASAQMKERIKQHFHDYYLLTGDVDALDFIQQIETMQISTIHSYAKKIIGQLGFELGYGNELTISSSSTYLKARIVENVESYIQDVKLRRGTAGVESLGMPIYQIIQSVQSMIERLHNQSVDIERLMPESFGMADREQGNQELHHLFQTVVPKVQAEIDQYYRDLNKIPLSVSMSLLKKCIDNEENQKRLQRAQTGKPQYLFVDEFQDTDDVQIYSLSHLASLLEYQLFVVGDVKQCIYRFRGAQENAFEQLKSIEAEVNGSTWAIYSLTKNYRTDWHLLNLFHESFSRMGQTIIDGQKMLIYEDEQDQESSRLKGTRDFHNDDEQPIYYHKVSINAEDQRFPALFQEVKRYKDYIEKRNSSDQPFSKQENEIAILVRENWQAEIIRKEGAKRGFEIITNTGGDLYTSESALDMLVLAQALLHYDEADYLYQLVSSNFIKCTVSKASLYLSRKQQQNSWRNRGQKVDTPVDLLTAQINCALASADDPSWGTPGVK